ncbi:hypothetical protein [Aminivibrio sp.]|jgi:hypothetical protein|uniref:hypothetical protein n=1 Tax=Aminivibrio sp. TaxID=1872489 RepID=UPI00345E1834
MHPPTGFQQSGLHSRLSRRKRDVRQGILPGILKAKDLLDIARDITEAKKKGEPLIAMLGGHVIKCGCVPVLFGLVKMKMLGKSTGARTA